MTVFEHFRHRAATPFLWNLKAKRISKCGGQVVLHHRIVQDVTSANILSIQDERRFQMQHLKLPVSLFRSAVVGRIDEDRIVENTGISGRLHDDADHPVCFLEALVIFRRIPTGPMADFVNISNIKGEEVGFFSRIYFTARSCVYFSIV